MKRRDLIFLLLAAVIVAVLVLGTRGDEAPRLPDDGNHRPFAAALARGGKRAAVEAGCVTCHNSRQRPLPPKHPPKEQCLICHEP